jgi:hypothetical protein
VAIGETTVSASTYANGTSPAANITGIPQIWSDYAAGVQTIRCVVDTPAGSMSAGAVQWMMLE